MNEPLTAKASALLLLLTALLVIGDFRLIATVPLETSVKIAPADPAPATSSQPLFPGQPGS